jgi:hypothetical protein
MGFDRMEANIQYSVDEIKDDRIALIHNYNNEDYNKVVLHFEADENSIEKIRNRIHEKYEEYCVWLNMGERFKVPEDIIERLPDAELIKGIAEIIYMQGGKIIDVETIKYLR